MSINIRQQHFNDGRGTYWLSRAMPSLIIFLATFTIFVAFPSQQYDKDTLLELKLINELNIKSSDPAHMAYVVLGVPIYQIWLRLGYGGDALRAMQFLNGIFGAGTLSLFALILQQLKIRTIVVILITFLVGFSYAFWTHTADAFFIIPAAFFALASLLFALVSSKVTSRNQLTATIIVGFSLSLAALFYQANLLLFPALMAASWNLNNSWRRRISLWILIAVLVVVIAGGIWLVQGTTVAQVRNLSELIDWFVLRPGLGNGLWRREGVPLISTSLTALLATLLPVYEGIGLRGLFEGQLTHIHVSSQGALALIGMSILLMLVTLERSYRRGKAILKRHIFVACGLWFCVPGAAVLLFDPAEIKLWLIPMFAFWIFFAAAFNRHLSFEARYSRQVLSKGLIVGLLITVFIGSFILAIWPNYKKPSAEFDLARTAIEKITPEDLLISATFDWTYYVRYLCNSCRVVNLIDQAQIAEESREVAVTRTINNLIEKTWKGGGSVYAVHYFGERESALWDSWITRFTGVTSDFMSNFYKNIAWRAEDEIVWELKKPRADS